jgi:hypothetical protein
MNSQVVPAEPLGQNFQYPSGVGFMLATNDKIIGKTNHEALSLEPRLYVLYEPFIQHVVQEYVGQHRRCYPALWCPFVGIHHIPAFEHPGVEPFADEPQYSSIFHFLLNETSEMLVIDGIEKSTYICIHYPVDVQLDALLAQFPYRLMLTMTSSEAVGERIEYRLEDSSQDHYHRSLDDLVLIAGFSDGPQLAVFLLDPYPFDGRNCVPVCFEPFAQVVEKEAQVGIVIWR